jgi:uncharacterized protein (TIGR02453 family)
MPRAAGPLDVTAALAFLRELRKNNDRGWFEAHRERFDTLVKPGFEDLVAALLVSAVKFDERFAYIEPKRCIFRIYRDVRFSNDKTPYKTRLSAFLSPRGWRGTTPGFYIAIEPGGESMMAAGIYTPEKPVLEALRRRFADGDPAFERICRAKRFAPYLPLDTDPLVRRAFTDAELTRGDGFVPFRDAMRDTAAFVGWLDQSVSAAGAAEPEEDGE